MPPNVENVENVPQICENLPFIWRKATSEAPSKWSALFRLLCRIQSFLGSNIILGGSSLSFFFFVKFISIARKFVAIVRGS